MNKIHPTDPVFDLPKCEAPKFIYMIASTPRAGGNYFSKILWETGVLGRPAEYFNFNRTVFRLSARFGTETPDDYWAALVRKRTTANSVFGFKAHYDHLQFLFLTGLVRRFTHFKVVRLIRDDPIAEAVSFSRAVQTESWSSYDKQTGSVSVYNVDHLNWCLTKLTEQKRGWDSFFSKYKHDYETISYDDLCSDPVNVAKRTVRALGYPTSPVQKSVLPEMSRQADQLNAEWIKRYQADASRIKL